MTENPNQWSEDALSGAIAAAVDELASATDVDEMARARARRRMHDVFDESVVDGPDVAQLTMVDDRGRRLRPWMLATAAAAVVAVLVSGLVWLGDREPEVPADVPPPPATVVPLPSTLEPGSYSTDALGFDVTFTLEDEVVIERLESGLIEMRSSSTPTESIAFVRPTALADELGVDELDDLFQPSTGAQRRLAEVDGIDAVEWDTFGAQPDGPCAANRCASLFEQPRLVGVDGERFYRVVLVPVAGDVEMVVIITGSLNQGTGLVFGDVLDNVVIDRDVAAPPVIPSVVGQPQSE